MAESMQHIGEVLEKQVHPDAQGKRPSEVGERKREREEEEEEGSKTAETETFF